MDEFPYANVADPWMSEPYSIGLVTTRGTQPYQQLVHKRTTTFATVVARDWFPSQTSINSSEVGLSITKGYLRSWKFSLGRRPGHLPLAAPCRAAVAPCAPGARRRRGLGTRTTAVQKWGSASPRAVLDHVTFYSYQPLFDLELRLLVGLHSTT